MTAAPLQLDALPLATGGFREIHQHPGQEDLLVKVLRPAKVADRPKLSGMLTMLRRYGRYTPYLRELREYLAVRARAPECPPIVQRCYGFVDTNRGLGMVVEKFVGRDGALAPTVASIASKQGISSRLWELCEIFYDEVRRHELVVSDLNPRNIVWTVEGSVDQLVLIDGLGEKGLIPMRSISRAYNRYRTESAIRRSKLRIMQYAAGLYRPGRITRAMARRLRLDELLDRPPATRPDLLARHER